LTPLIRLPTREALEEKPKNVPYPQSEIKIGHYGKIVQQMIEKACALPEGDERLALTKVIAGLMKRFHLTFNSTSLEDQVIANHLKLLSKGQLILTDLSCLPNTNEILKQNGTAGNPMKAGFSNNKNKNKKKKKNGMNNSGGGQGFNREASRQNQNQNQKRN
jgi:hypothetical protein